MKLELKHLAPYLPYNIRMSVINRYNTGDGFWTLEGNECDLECRNIEIQMTHCKPILHPLSDLTKEIEINEEKFIPMFRLFELEYSGTTHFDEHVRGMYVSSQGRFLICSHLGTAADISVNIIQLNKNNYWKIDRMLEWNFDVFGLIEKGLAVDINTLK